MGLQSQLRIHMFAKLHLNPAEAGSRQLLKIFSEGDRLEDAVLTQSGFPSCV